MTEFLGRVYQQKSIVVGAIKNVMLRRILLVLVPILEQSLVTSSTSAALSWG